MRIALVSPEVYPFAKTGGLADVCGTLPLKLEERGHDVVVILPLYRCVDTTKLRPFRKGVSVATIGKNVPVYFLENKRLYDRAGIFGTGKKDYPDNAERFSYLCHKSLQLLRELKVPVDIIHCNDWQTGLLPVLLKDARRQSDLFFVNTRSVMTIHNLAYQGLFDRSEYPALKIPQDHFHHEGVEYYGKINFLKAGIVYADMVSTVSEQYAKEIQTEEYGCGLHGVLHHKRPPVTGILNGIDYETWNPEADALITPNYGPDSLEKKRILKQGMQKALGLRVDADVPVFGFVGRLAQQKGLDLIAKAIKPMLERDIQFVILGSGEAGYQKLITDRIMTDPTRVSVKLKFDEKLAHMIYAGSDIFVMPSVYEPCGLGQMIALSYGTVPLVHKTGGLVDTIHEFNQETGNGNGFLFPEYTVRSYLEAVDRALGVYHHGEDWKKLVRAAIMSRFTWNQSVMAYEQVYTQCLSLA